MKYNSNKNNARLKLLQNAVKNLAHSEKCVKAGFHITAKSHRKKVSFLATLCNYMKIRPERINTFKEAFNSFATPYDS